MKSKIYYSILLTIIATLIVATIITLTFSNQLNAAGSTGNWKYICCGKQCDTGEYCYGSGKYVCCKDEESIN